MARRSSRAESHSPTSARGGATRAVAVLSYPSSPTTAKPAAERPERGVTLCCGCARLVLPGRGGTVVFGGASALAGLQRRVKFPPIGRPSKSGHVTPHLSVHSQAVQRACIHRLIRLEPLASESPAPATPYRTHPKCRLPVLPSPSGCQLRPTPSSLSLAVPLPVRASTSTACRRAPRSSGTATATGARGTRSSRTRTSSS